MRIIKRITDTFIEIYREKKNYAKRFSKCQCHVFGTSILPHFNFFLILHKMPKIIISNLNYVFFFNLINDGRK